MITKRFARQLKLPLVLWLLKGSNFIFYMLPFFAGQLLGFRNIVFRVVSGLNVRARHIFAV
jgi:hypothetical protein